MSKFKINSKYSTIFFDWSGVIADDNGDEFIRQSLLDVGATKTQITKILRKDFNDFMCGNLSEDEYWNILKNKYRLNIPNHYSGVFDKWKGIVPNNDMTAILEEIKNKGIKISLITNIIKPIFDIINELGYYDIFNDTIASCEVNLIKPHPEIYELAIKRMGAKTKESIFIDDKQSNIDTAINMGFKTILAKNSQQICLELRSIIK